MAELKTKQTEASVEEYLDTIGDPRGPDCNPEPMRILREERRV